jgi:hypothetical protein
LIETLTILLWIIIFTSSGYYKIADNKFTRFWIKQ